ncbi:MAG TPA: polysaccharide biosynthesis tyrosine autokinase [Candidatus Obscuribacterales bacterium]
MNELQQYWSVFKRRWFPMSLIFGAAIALSAFNTSQQILLYQARGQLLFRKNTTSALTGVGRQLGQLESTVQGKPLMNEATILTSMPIAQRTINKMGHSIDPQEFLKNLRVENLEGTDILQVSYINPEPQTAADLVNTLMEQYIQLDIEANRSETRTAREFLEAEVPKAKAQLEAVEQAIRRLKEQNRVVDLDTEASSTTNILQELDQQIADARAGLATETARVESLRLIFGKDAQETTVAGFVGESPTTIPALDELQKIQQKIATERLRFSETHPVIQQLRKEEEILKAELARRVEQSFVGASDRIQDYQDPSNIVQLRNQGLQQGLINSYAQAEANRASLERRISALSEVLETYRQRANSLPALEIKQLQLEREQETAKNTYQQLLDRLQDIQIADKQQVGNARIVAPAQVPDQPILSRQYAQLVRGTVLGLILAIVVAWLLETTEKKIRNSQTARELLPYPLLGAIPMFSRRLVVRDDPGSRVSEAFRSLQTNLRFVQSDRQIKVIVVTSAVPREGKSTIAANLAVATAQLGRRVLLIDGDLRLSSQHKLWSISNEMGLSAVLRDAVPLAQAISEVMPNLWVLPSGDRPPNPVALLDSSQMGVLIGNISKNYDLVIIDTPPLTAAADATILGKMTDGVVMVTRPGVADLESAKFSKELLEQSKQIVLGLVVNGSATKSLPYRYDRLKAVKSANFL